MIAFRVTDDSGQTRLWTLDAGASRVTRPAQIDDISEFVRERVVEIPCDCDIPTREMKSGEISLPGAPFCPVGRSVRIGQLALNWTHGGKPAICRLTNEQASGIQKILGRASCSFTCRVRGDIPYLTEGQAHVIRDSIDLRHAGLKLKSKRAIETHIKGIYDLEDSIGFLGCRDRKFDIKIEKNSIFRGYCHCLQKWCQRFP